MKKALVILFLAVLLAGCAVLGPPVPPRVFDPVTMTPGEWPY